jgi:S-DNA-T family DNA segregation ATPase FtsK/SpoIIIE
MPRHAVAGAEPAPLAAPARAQPAAEPQSGFLAGLLKRNETMPEPELVTQALPETTQLQAGDPDRVSARIADAIKNRTPRPSPTGVRIEPALTAGRGPQPLVFTPLEEDTSADEDLIEVPVSAQVAPAAETVVAPPEAPSDAPRMAAPHRPIPQVNLPATAAVATATAAAEAAQRSVVQHPPKRAPQPSRQAREEAQPALKFDDKYASYDHPPLGLLTSSIEIQRHHLSDEALEENARMLESVLDDYGVKGEIVSVRPGPVVTMYELEPAPGLKASRVIGLSDDIARSMSALSARVSTVPGR